MAAKPNPDPARITAAMWRLWTEFDAHRPATELGGIYAFKSGYHSTRADNQKHWPGDYSTRLAADRKGPGDKSAAVDLTFDDAQHGSYAQICTYTKRLVDAAKRRDPRLYVGATPVLREVIGTVDGKRPYAYDLQERQGDHDRDDSHMWHIHLSITRQFVDDWNILAGVLSVLIGESIMALTKADADVIWTRDRIPAPSRYSKRKENPTWTADGAVARILEDTFGLWPTVAAIRAEQLAAKQRDAVLLEAVKGAAETDEILSHIDDGLAQLRDELKTDLAAELLAELRDALGDGLAEEQMTNVVEAAVRKVFGSVDEQEPAA